MLSEHAADRQEYWTQDHWAKVQATRVAEGRCARCGSFDGPDHRCPQDTVTKTNNQEGSNGRR